MTALLSVNALNYLLLFVAGLIMGSFFNTVIYRFPRKLSLVFPRSFCVHCKTKLQVPDLLPLASFFFIKGRCRHCGVQISWRYPLVELLTAIIVLLCYIYFGFSHLFFKYAVFFSILLIISFIDLDRGIIPDRLVLLLMLWSSAWQLFNPEINLKEAGLGLLAGGGLFYLIAVLSKGGMGGGDIKLMAVLGFTVGWPLVFVVFFLAFFIGAFVGLILLFVQNKSWKDPLPFGPFLSLSFVISIFWGLLIWQWYLLYV